MFTFLLIVQTLVALALAAVILMQRSEGGGLGVGGSSAGLMTARGAADFLTRATSVLAGAFILLSILLAVMAYLTIRSTRHDHVYDITEKGQPTHTEDLYHRRN